MNRPSLPSITGFNANRSILTIAICAAAACGVWAQSASGPADAPAASKPTSLPSTLAITTADTPVGKLLKQWWAEGTAAGNVADWYDNRDRGHSGLRIGTWPQLQKVEYDAKAKAANADWAGQRVILPKVVFGNSSTSAGAANGGSNVRMYYDSARGLAFLYAEYTHNNIYMYPEHRDHDPGHNGAGGGYGDLFCTNTPYLIASQGSSSSDQPFMRAVANTLAAFRPEVKKKLVESGLLMPTIQMILRSTMAPVEKPEDYLTGKAHPTVFVGAGVNDVKMVEMAHGIDANSIPPMMNIKVVKESVPEINADPSIPPRSEKQADTPAVIARIWRGLAYTRTMTVSAEASGDLNNRPLTYTWVVLRGDPQRIKITPDKTGATAEITVCYPYRRPIEPGSPMESNRVDIGVFAHNGKYYSAPGFITFFSLDNEARTYDDKGRLLEIAYNNGDASLTINWPEMFDLLSPQADTAAAKFIKEKFTKPQLEALLKAAEEYKPAAEAAAEAKKKFQEAQKAAKEKDAPKSAADASRKTQKDSEAADKAAEEIVSKKRDNLGGSTKDLVEGVLNDMLNDIDFYKNNEKTIQSMLTDKTRGIIDAARKRMLAYGLIKDMPDQITFEPLLGPDVKLSDHIPANGSASAPAAATGRPYTRYEFSQIKRFNGEILGGVIFLDAITAKYAENYVDTRLGASKPYRDVFRYDDTGKRASWIRYDGKTKTILESESPSVEK